MSDDEFETIYMTSDVMNNVTNSSTTDKEQIEKRSIADHVVWTGPILKCFDWRD